jgi:NADH dehydrogenase
VLFGVGDILLNNIAFMLRHFPLFPVPGNGRYRIQPIYVKDLAELALEAGNRSDNYTLDAVGPEAYEYFDLVQMIRQAIGSKSRVVRTPEILVRFASGVLGLFLKDVILTNEEIKGLVADLLVSANEPTGGTGLRDWVTKHSINIGKSYASELRRHYVVS